MKLDNPRDRVGQSQHVLILGEPKTGKSLYGATAARDPGDVFFVVADPQGYQTLLTNGLEPPCRFVDLGNPYESTVEIINDLLEAEEAGERYSAVVIDDLSTLQARMKGWIEDAKEDEITSKKGVVDPRKIYGFLKNYMIDLVSRFQELNSHVIYLTWAREPQPDSGRAGGPMLEGQGGDWVSGMCNAVVLLRLKKVVDQKRKDTVMLREVRTQPYAGYALGSRFNLPDPFPYDLKLDEDGGKPTWTKGLHDLLQYGVLAAAPKKAAAKKTKKRR